MKNRTKRIFLVISGVFIFGIGGVAWLGYTVLSIDSAADRASAIECTLAWGRLAPFPSSAQNFTITTSGTIFTRSFRSSFTAPLPDIESWLQQSAGTRDTLPTRPEPGILHFKIAPGDGAMGAEVTVDQANRKVSIYVVWS